MKHIKKIWSKIFPILFSLVVFFLVYYTGGTPNVYTNLMYIPIVIVASTYGKTSGALLSFLNGILLGPLLIALGKSSENYGNWGTRLGMYILIAIFIGYQAEKARKQSHEIIQDKEYIVQTQISLVHSLVKITETRDEETGNHITRIAEFCKLIAHNLKDHSAYKQEIDTQFIKVLYESSPLHDIGKVGISDTILLKPSKLTADEFEKMKTHTIIGANILIDVQKQYPNNEFINMGVLITKNHHEKWDGSGYPLGLLREEIPISARIVAFADVYDALRSKRIYKDAYCREETIKIIKQNQGTHFDPYIVDVFLNIEHEFNAIFEKYS